MEISVVYQSPIFTNTNADQAIKDSVELAQYSDQIGLKRFWLAEHHGSNSFAGCSPEILIPRIASSTKNIRVGSGGVMLMHYSPYKVAENFRLLESMFPRRIDLGLGRAPGSDPFQAGALAYGSKTTGPEFFPTKMNDLRSFLSNQTPETKSFENVNVTPGLGDVPDTWLLVSSEQGADYASFFGLPMSLAYFINQDCLHLAKPYRENFQKSIFGDSPQVSVAVFAICAETNEEANLLASSASIWRENVSKGIFGPFPTLEEATKKIKDKDKEEGKSIVGDQKFVEGQLMKILEETNADELKIITICESMSSKKESYRLIKEIFS